METWKASFLSLGSQSVRHAFRGVKMHWSCEVTAKIAPPSCSPVRAILCKARADGRRARMLYRLRHTLVALITIGPV